MCVVFYYGSRCCCCHCLDAVTKYVYVRKCEHFVTHFTDTDRLHRWVVFWKCRSKQRPRNKQRHYHHEHYSILNADCTILAHVVCISSYSIFLIFSEVFMFMWWNDKEIMCRGAVVTSSAADVQFLLERKLLEWASIWYTFHFICNLVVSTMRWKWF